MEGDKIINAGYKCLSDSYSMFGHSYFKSQNPPVPFCLSQVGQFHGKMVW